LLVDWQ